MTRKRGRTAAVFAVVAGLLIPTAATASADPGFPTEVETGSLTITKLSDPGGELADGTGLPADNPDGTHPLPGVTFRIQKVPGVDLTTENGWQLASNMTVDQARAKVADALPLPTNVDRTDRTDGEGVVVFDNLPLGLYVVTEEGVPPNVIASGIPFLVTIPMTDPVDLNRWVYDVNVYPKNADTTTTKTVDDSDASFLGDYVWFDVTMTVPRGAEKLTFTDELDPRLEFVLDNESFFWITGYKEPEPPTGPELMTAELEPRLGEVDLAEGWTTRDPDVLTVTFDRGFLEGYEGDTVGFRIRAKVAGILGGDGTVEMDDGWIRNQAQYIVHTPNGAVTEGKSEEVVTKWGTIAVHKVGSMEKNGTVGPLPGAEFCLAKDEQRARDGECDLAGGVTDESGNVRFTVRYSDWAKNATLVPPQSYWLFETKAPEGFELMADPLEVLLLEADGGVKEYEVTNYPHNAGFDLPVIGGNRAVLPIVAAVIAAGGVVWLIRSRREQKA